MLDFHVTDHTLAIALANAYVWGLHGGTRGHSFATNPYGDRGAERQEWQRGWREGVAATIAKWREERGL